MTSHGNDVIGRCAVDAEKGAATTRRFYVMTTLDDDVSDVTNDDVIDVDACAERAEDDDRSPQTGEFLVNHRDDNNRDNDDDNDDDDDDDDEKQRQWKQTLPDRQEDDAAEVTGDERLASDRSEDSNDETLCQSDDDRTSSKHNRHSPSTTARRRSTEDGTPAGQETAAKKESDTQDVSPALADITGTEPERDVSRTTPENAERSPVEHRVSTATTNEQPVCSVDTGTGNKISFDRKLVDEIDAAMAQNGYKTLLLRTNKSAKCKYPVPGGQRRPHDSTHNDHVTTTDKDNQSDPCRAEDTDTKSAGTGNTGNRRQKRSSTSGQHRQKLATSATGGAELTEDESDVETTSSECVALDQAWDTYQSPLYHVTAGDSDDEEKLDASVLLQRLQGDYDDVVCVSSDQSLKRRSRRQHAALNRKSQSKQKDHVTSAGKHKQFDESSSDVDDFDCVIDDSRRALNLTRAAVDPSSPHHAASTLEALATCHTNIDCLQTLLDAVRAADQRQTVSELLGEWRQLDSDIELLLQTTHSVTSFNATDELKADILQSSFNSTPSNWVTGSAGSRDSCHVQLMSDNGGFLQQTPSSRQEQKEFQEQKYGIKLQRDSDRDIESLTTTPTISTRQRIRRHLQRSRDAIPAILLVGAVLSMTLVLNYLVVTCDVFVQAQLRYVMGPPPS